MKIYIDSDYKCHSANPDGSYREIDVPFFDDKCIDFIEGYRFVPCGESWENEDGQVFEGEMVAPWSDFDLLHMQQMQYELEDAENALSILLGGNAE